MSVQGFGDRRSHLRINLTLPDAYAMSASMKTDSFLAELCRSAWRCQRQNLLRIDIHIDGLRSTRHL